MGMPVITSSKVNRCNAITDIIMSVALEQASLAHILNAEGEKLQKIIKTQENPEIILKTNKSVLDMVEAVAKLENVLQNKLALFEDCLCKDCYIKIGAESESEVKDETAVVKEAVKEEIVEG